MRQVLLVPTSNGWADKFKVTNEPATIWSDSDAGFSTETRTIDSYQFYLLSFRGSFVILLNNVWSSDRGRKRRDSITQCSFFAQQFTQVSSSEPELCCLIWSRRVWPGTDGLSVSVNWWRGCSLPWSQQYLCTAVIVTYHWYFSNTASLCAVIG